MPTGTCEITTIERIMHMTCFKDSYELTDSTTHNISVILETKHSIKYVDYNIIDGILYPIIPNEDYDTDGHFTITYYTYKKARIERYESTAYDITDITYDDTLYDVRIPENTWLLKD